MIGLVLGSWHISNFLERIKKPLHILISIQGSLAFYAIALTGIIILFHKRSPLSQISFILEMGFPFLTLVAGYLGGLHFPLINSIYLAERKGVGRVAGLIYGTDLVGSAVGALLTGLIFVPVLGILHTLYFITSFNVFAVGLLGFIKFRRYFSTSGL